MAGDRLRIVMSSIMRRRRGLNSAISVTPVRKFALQQAQSLKTRASTANRPAKCRVSGFVQLACISSSINAILALTGDKPREWGNSELSAGIIRPLGQRVARTTLTP